MNLPWSQTPKPLFHPANSESYTTKIILGLCVKLAVCSIQQCKKSVTLHQIRWQLAVTHLDDRHVLVSIDPENNYFNTILTNLSTKYLVMCKVYTDVGGIN